MRFFPVVGWAERGDGRARGHGNSVPRFHVTWGTGPGVARAVRAPGRAPPCESGQVSVRFRHRVDELVTDGGAVVGVRGSVLAPAREARGVPTNRDADRRVRAARPGGGRHLRRHRRQPRPGAGELAAAPRHARRARWSPACPAYVDGRMLAIAERAGGRLVNRDRMWHYVEGLQNWDPIWPGHGIRILPGPSSLWFDALGRRLPAPLFPGFDTLGTLAHLRHHRPRPLLVRPDPHDHREGVRPLGVGAEPRPHRPQHPPGPRPRPRRVQPRPVEAFLRHGADFVVARSVPELVAGHEPADARAAARRRRARARDRRARPGGRQPLLQGRPAHGGPRRPHATAATG